MKKIDIIQLIKETIAERRKHYGVHDKHDTGHTQTKNISGYPGVWEDKLEELDTEEIEVEDSEEVEIEDEKNITINIKEKNTKDMEEAVSIVDPSTPTEPKDFKDKSPDAVNLAIQKAKDTGKPVPVAEDELEEMGQFTSTPGSMYPGKGFEYWAQRPDELARKLRISSDKVPEILAIAHAELVAQGMKPDLGKVGYKDIKESQQLNEAEPITTLAALAGLFAAGGIFLEPAAMEDVWDFITQKSVKYPFKETSYKEAMMESYMKKRGNNDLMEYMDKHRKREVLMEGAMKKFFEMFDKGMTDEEVVQDYAQRGTQVPETLVSKARKNWGDMEKMKLELEMGEKEFKNSARDIVNNPDGTEAGMEPREDKQLASGFFNEELDPVGQEDDDVNNDGKVDRTDSYLKAKRKKTAKAIEKQKSKK